MKKVLKRVVSSKTSYWLGLIISLSVYLSLTVGNINRSGLWFDEAFSAYLTNFNLFEITKYTAADVHPPMYYWLLKLWTVIFGQSEIAYRSLSIVFGVLALFIASLLISKMFGRKAAALAVFLMSISPMFIRYSDEARMYTLVLAICLGATYILIEAVQTNKKSKWVQYGLLVALGMWTHYFTAIVWLSHWLWRYIATRLNNRKQPSQSNKFFSKNWVNSHILAVVLFLAWMPFMILQLGGIQITNFWIGPVGINSFTNFLTNTFYYLEYQQVINWQAAAIFFIVFCLILGGRTIYKNLEPDKKDYYLLLLVMSLGSPLILFIVSLPPLKSSYVERYLLTASVMLILFIAVNIYYGLKMANRMIYLICLLVVLIVSFLGVQNVYYYGNYNKNSSTYVSTRELISEVNSRSGAGTAIIAQSPWTYYEAFNYQKSDNPLYFVDSDTDYKYGSLLMLKDNNTGKILDIDKFINEHPVFWYIGYSRDGNIKAPYKNICVIDQFEIKNSVDGRSDYKAVKYKSC